MSFDKEKENTQKEIYPQSAYFSIKKACKKGRKIASPNT